VATTLAVGVVLLCASLASALSSSAAGGTAPEAHAARTYHRCATFHDENSPYAHPGHANYGVYVTRGRISCQSAIQVMTAVFTGKGRAVEGTSYTLYHRWYCGGQMGGYSCQSSLHNPAGTFDVLACAAPLIGCPVNDSKLGP
jgi:hypothetical protein